MCVNPAKVRIIIFTLNNKTDSYSVFVIGNGPLKVHSYFQFVELSNFFNFYIFHELFLNTLCNSLEGNHITYKSKRLCTSIY